jgi:hypothetical protein
MCSESVKQVKPRTQNFTQIMFLFLSLSKIEREDVDHTTKSDVKRTLPKTVVAYILQRCFTSTTYLHRLVFFHYR